VTKRISLRTSIFAFILSILRHSVISEDIPVEKIDNFDNMGLRPELLRGIYSYGFEKPSAIQQKAIVPTIRFVFFFLLFSQCAISSRFVSCEFVRLILSGRDIIAQAQSGTGKTATFAIGCLQQLDYTKDYVQALILAPTRELATQIQKVVVALGDFLNAKAYACIGGNSIRDGTLACSLLVCLFVSRVVIFFLYFLAFLGLLYLFLLRASV
jgi:hypothetical protein